MKQDERMAVEASFGFSEDKELVGGVEVKVLADRTAMLFNVFPQLLERLKDYPTMFVPDSTKSEAECLKSWLETMEKGLKTFSEEERERISLEIRMLGTAFHQAYRMVIPLFNLTLDALEGAERELGSWEDPEIFGITVEDIQ